MRRKIKSKILRLLSSKNPRKSRLSLQNKNKISKKSTNYQGIIRKVALRRCSTMPRTTLLLSSMSSSKKRSRMNTCQQRINYRSDLKMALKVSTNNLTMQS
jgi:hypothetical protein